MALLLGRENYGCGYQPKWHPCNTLLIGSVTLRREPYPCSTILAEVEFAFVLYCKKHGQESLRLMGNYYGEGRHELFDGLKDATQNFLNGKFFISSAIQEFGSCCNPENYNIEAVEAEFDSLNQYIDLLRELLLGRRFSNIPKLKEGKKLIQ